MNELIDNICAFIYELIGNISAHSNELLIILASLLLIGLCVFLLSKYRSQISDKWYWSLEDGDLRIYSNGIYQTCKNKYTAIMVTVILSILINNWIFIFLFFVKNSSNRMLSFPSHVAWQGERGKIIHRMGREVQTQGDFSDWIAGICQPHRHATRKQP